MARPKLTIIKNEVSIDEFKRLQKTNKKDSSIRSLIAQCVGRGLPLPEREVTGLIPGRRFRVDLLWRDAGIIVEYEGGVTQHMVSFDEEGHINRSRHLTPEGFRQDCIKYARLQMLGFMVLRFEVGLVNSGEAADMIAEAYSSYLSTQGRVEAILSASRAIPSPIVAKPVLVNPRGYLSLLRGE